MTYRDAIAEGRRLYADAMDKAANQALFIVHRFDKPLREVCREIAGTEGEGALRARCQRLSKRAGQTPDELARAQERAVRESAQRHAKVVLKDPEQAAKVIASLPPETLETVYHEARLARSGEDRTPAARKAARASASNAVAPLKRAVASTSSALCVEALREATEDLREALDEDVLTAAALSKIEKAHGDFVDVLTEAALRLEGVGA